MPSHNTLFSLVAVGILAFAWLAWILMQPAVRVRLTHWHRADSSFEPCRGDELSPDMNRMIDTLVELGFGIRGHWRHTGHSHARALMTVLEHPRTYDVAKVLLTTSGRRRHLTLLLQTRFDDGTEVATGNNELTVGLPSPPEITGLWLPQVHDPRDLCRIHQQVSQALEAGKTRIAIGPDPEAFLIEGRDRVIAHHVETGYYSYDRIHDIMRPTWKGAILMTWRLRWPVRPLYFAWRQQRTQRLLRELDVSVAPSNKV
jgi:hypothetical protein